MDRRSDRERERAQEIAKRTGAVVDGLCKRCGLDRPLVGGQLCLPCISEAHDAKRPKRSLSTRFRGTSAYRAWRLAVLERDAGTCRICSKVPAFPQVDHIQPMQVIVRESGARTVEELLAYGPALDIENGRVLCGRCHGQAETTPDSCRDSLERLSQDYADSET